MTTKSFSYRQTKSKRAIIDESLRLRTPRGCRTCWYIGCMKQKNNQWYRGCQKFGRVRLKCKCTPIYDTLTELFALVDQFPKDTIPYSKPILKFGGPRLQGTTASCWSFPQKNNCK